ncbi:MAG TPA: hypothetical protein PKM25_17980, partial [Candidatus Ozemobacteraceae bacterium]|nr:hypothetical protein [Candidatus Ozemobacteraceae bacterium]
MNSILMVVVAVIVILLVFVMFSLDDQEELPVDETALKPGSGEDGENEATDGPADETRGVVAKPASADERPQAPGSVMTAAGPEPVEPGTEQDLQYRLLLDDQVPSPTDVIVKQAVAVVVQIRFPEEFQAEQEAWAKVLGAAEAILAPEKAPFPYSVYLTRQFDHLWLFGIDEERDDPIFEAIVCAFDAVRRFKKALESQPLLSSARARLAVGISSGKVVRIKRGPLGPVSHAGTAVYLAETLAEAAGDFMVYVDEDVHKLSLPLFDFREWKPIKLRPPLPPMAFFEVMGWNKKEEMFAFASHKEAYARRA